MLTSYGWILLLFFLLHLVTKSNHYRWLVYYYLLNMFLIWIVLIYAGSETWRWRGVDQWQRMTVVVARIMHVGKGVPAIKTPHEPWRAVVQVVRCAWWPWRPIHSTRTPRTAKEGRRRSNILAPVATRSSRPLCRLAGQDSSSTCSL